MIDARSLIFALDDKVDRLNTEGQKAILIVSMCRALTEAQSWLLRKYAKPIEIDKEHRHLLLPLEMKDVTVKTKKSGRTSHIEFPPDYYRDLGIRVVAVKRDCPKKEIGLTKMESGDRGRAANNPYWKSSYAWNQAFGDEAHDGFYIYNGDDFKVESIIIDYLKRPKEIHCPSLVEAPDRYVDWHGNPQTQDSGWILDDLVDEGINRAALILTRNIGDAADFDLQTRNNAITEQ